MPRQPDSPFIELVNQHIGIPHKICSAYTFDQAEHEDLFQEMMFHLWRSFEKFEGRSKFTTWMYQVCLNTALTYKRKREIRKTEPLRLQHMQIAEDATVLNEDLEALSSAIAELAPLNKAIALLYLDELTYEEIAEVTGLSVSNVGVRLVRLKKELAKKLKEKI